MSSDKGPGRLSLFALATAAALLFITGSLVNATRDPGPAVRILLALLPVAPLAALAWSIHRAVRRFDELQRRIQLDAMTGAFVGAAFVALVVGQLQHARVGVPELNWAFLWPVQVILWAIAYILAARRYE
jgi:hypothetical protein